MATKKSLCWLAGLSFCTLFMLGCQNLGLKTRSQINQTQAQTQETHPTQDNDLQQEEGSPGTPINPAIIEKPEFLKKGTPRLGLILSGGGALSLAHVGVLQELESQKVPIHSISGVEWGALVAGSYATKTKAHATEWKLLKIPHEKFSSRSFFSSGKQDVGVDQFSAYLTDVLGKVDFADLEIPFSCVSIHIPSETILLNNRGHLKKAIENCWPYPPHFAVESNAAHPTAVAELAQNLRRNGAEIIVYIDVLSDNKLLSDKDRKSSPLNATIWSQAKKNGDSLKGRLIDEVIKVSLSGHHINSYQSLRAIVRMGQVKSKEQISQLVKKYAY